VVKSNRDYIRRGGVPLLYQSGVIYQNDNDGKPGQLDFFDDIPVILDRGWGDCLHLSCWRVAELLEQGHRASVAVDCPPFSRPGELRTFHVLVRRARGVLECPSSLLGMPPWQPPPSPSP